MDFSNALKEMRNGYAARRTSWPYGYACWLVPPFAGRLAEIVIRGEAGVQPFPFAQYDVLAENWERIDMTINAVTGHFEPPANAGEPVPGIYVCTIPDCALVGAHGHTDPRLMKQLGEDYVNGVWQGPVDFTSPTGKVPWRLEIEVPTYGEEIALAALAVPDLPGDTA